MERIRLPRRPAPFFCLKRAISDIFSTYDSNKYLTIRLNRINFALNHSTL
jgi:hypothetical protein